MSRAPVCVVFDKTLVRCPMIRISAINVLISKVACIVIEGKKKLLMKMKKKNQRYQLFHNFNGTSRQPYSFCSNQPNCTWSCKVIDYV